MTGFEKVIYFDFELTDKQFENRYSVNFANHYYFADNLIRIEINPDPDIPDGISFETYLNQSIEQTIVQTGTHSHHRQYNLPPTGERKGTRRASSDERAQNAQK
jgi:hypothetical protein